MSYYFGHVHERNGEQEYAIPVLFQTGDGESPEDVLDAIASGWYTTPDEPSGPDENQYFFSGGSLRAEAGTIQEVTDEGEIAALLKYLNETLRPEFRVANLVEVAESGSFLDLRAAYAALKAKDNPDDWEVECCHA